MKYNWLMLLLFIGIGCSTHDLDPDEPDQPVFKAQFAFDSVTHLIQAGVEEVYLFTDYRMGFPEVRVCSGTFAHADCPAGDCPGSLAFEFRNDRQGEELFADSLFIPGERSFFAEPQATGPIYRYSFSTLDTQDYHLFQWSIDGGSPLTGESFTQDFPDDSEHDVRLNAFSGGTLRSVVSRSVSADMGAGEFSETGIIVVDSFDYYRLTAQAAGSPVLDYIWNTDSSTQIISISQDDANATYRVGFVNTSGDTAFAQINGVIPGLLYYKTADFTYSVEEIAPDLLQLGSVNIRWIDENGVVWESQKGSQPAGTSFQILSSEPYENNENDEKTWKMTVSFSCLLYNASNPDESKFLSGTGVIAVAHP